MSPRELSSLNVESQTRKKNHLTCGGNGPEEDDRKSTFGWQRAGKSDRCGNAESLHSNARGRDDGLIPSREWNPKDPARSVSAWSFSFCAESQTDWQANISPSGALDGESDLSAQVVVSDEPIFLVCDDSRRMWVQRRLHQGTANRRNETFAKGFMCRGTSLKGCKSKLIFIDKSVNAQVYESMLSENNILELPSRSSSRQSLWNAS